MAADPEIRVSVTAVTGEAAAQLKQFADQQAAIQQRLVAAQIGLTSATAAYRDALKQLVPAGASANDVNAASLKILTEYKAQVDAAKLSVTEETAALKALKTTQVETTETTELFTFAQGAATEATGHFTKSLYGAQGASRLLSGNVPVRAFERFLSLIPGVSTALGVAFPIIGAIALVEIVGEGIEKLHKMRQEAEQAAENIDRAFRQMADGLRESNDQLLTRTAHLQAQLDKAYQRPGQNGAAEAFDEAAAAADRLGVSLDRDLEKIEQLTSAENKKDSIGFWQSLFSGKAETGDTSAFIKKQVDAIRQVNDEYSDLVNRAAASGDKANLAQAQEAQLVHLQSVYKTATDAITKDLEVVYNKQQDFKTQGWGEDQTAKINLLRGALNQLALEQKNIGEQFANQNLQEKVTLAPKKQPGVESQMRAYEDELNRLKDTVGPDYVGAQFEEQFWEQKLAIAKRGSSDYSSILQKVVDAKRKEAEEIKRFDEQVHEGITGAGSVFAQSQKDIAATEKEIREAAEANSKAYRERAQAAAQTSQELQTEAEAEHNITLAKIQAAEAQGQLTRVGADHAKAAADAELYRAKLEALRAELAQLIPTSQEYQRVLRQIQQIQGQQQVSQVNTQSKTAQDLAAPYVKATDTINQAWLGMQNKLIFGTRNVSQAFANMGVQMLESVAASFEKMLVRQLQYEIQSRIAHQASNTIQLASDAQATAAGDALHRQSALKQVFIDAKTAAAHTFKAVLGALPFPVNMILAPPAAAAAFTGVLAVGAFEKGGIVPQTGLALVHAEEGVLPRNLTKMLTSVANTYSGGSSSTMNSTVNQTTNFNGINDRNFRDMARRNADAVFDAAHGAIRSGQRRF